MTGESGASKKISLCYYEMGKEHLTNKNYYSAHECFKKISISYKDTKEQIYLCGKGFLEQKKYDKAAEIFHDLHSYSDSAELYNEAKYLYWRKRWD